MEAVVLLAEEEAHEVFNENIVEVESKMSKQEEKQFSKEQNVQAEVQEQSIGTTIENNLFGIFLFLYSSKETF